MSDPSPLAPLNDLDALDAALEASHRRPILLFKHSVWCDLSARALEELERFLRTAADPPASWMIVVQRARAISDDIARRFAVRHESPQALLLHRGALVWHASHRRITSEALAAAVTGAQQPAEQAEPLGVS
jgi:bacillithiol system protein YtxJ